MYQNKVSIIIVSYNTKELTLSCIRSIFRTVHEVELEVIVVDNNSKDGSVKAITAEFPEVSVIANKENVGFARANNQGVNISSGNYILFLNPDTELVTDTLEKTLDFAERTQDAGVVGCRAFLPDGSQQNTVLRFPSLTTVLISTLVPLKLRKKSRFLGRSRYIGIDLDEIQKVDVVAGCYMLIKREVIEQTGAFDNDFFMYGEESELCFRIWKAGWNIYYYPYSEFLHIGGGSTKKMTVTRALMMAKGQLLLIEKTRGRLVLYLSNILMFISDLAKTVILLFSYFEYMGEKNKFKSQLIPIATRLRFHFYQLFRLTVPRQPTCLNLEE